MNALDNEKDPFEDIFRDRFADFDSEPNGQLWRKIEPQLPVNPTRKIPYWQISMVALVVLLSGVGVYHLSKSTKKNSISSSGITQRVMTQSEQNSVFKEAMEHHIVVSKKSHSGTSSSQSMVASSQKRLLQSATNAVDEEQTKYIPDNITSKNANQVLKEELSTDVKLSESSAITLVNWNNSKKYNKNNKYSLNLFSSKASNKSIVENYHEINSDIFDIEGNKTPSFNVINSNKGFLAMTLDSKKYSLLSSNFKKLKLKNVLMPKVEEYFKESKPIDMYFSVMPLLNYYTITPNGNDANYVHGIAVNDDDDRLGFYTQGGVIFTLSDKFRLRTGLTFTSTNHSINYQIRTDSLVVQSPDNKGVDVSFAEIKKTYSQSANYLGTKIELQYIFLKGEALTHYVNVGAEGAYRLNGNHQFNGFANFAYGVTRQIGDNAYLFVEPTFSYSLNQQSDSNAFLLVKPNKIGFNIGINFKIK